LALWFGKIDISVLELTWMTRGRAWTVEEERQLREQILNGKNVLEISKTMNKTPMSVKAKMCDLNLRIIKPWRPPPLDLSGEVPSIEDKLKAMNAALKALEQPGLSHTEVVRLRTIVQGCKNYEQIFSKYVNYEALERELQEIKAKLAEQNKKRK
jgi:hypothetical protein